MKQTFIAFFVAMVLFSSFSLAFEVQPQELEIQKNPGMEYQKTFSLIIDSTNITETVQISAIVPFFETTVSPSSIISTNESATYPIDFTLTIPEHFSPGSYGGEVVFSSSGSQVAAGINITVLFFENCSVKMPEEITLNTGETSSINGTIENNGNANMDMQIGANLSVFEIVNFTSYKQTEEPFFLDYNVPINYKTGRRLVNFTFDGIQKLINVTVVDNIDPELEILSLGDISVARDFTITVNSTDNIAVEKVYSDLSCSHRSERGNFTKVGNEWRSEVKGFDQPQDCILQVCSVDTSDNKVCMNDSFSATYLKDFEVDEDLNLLKFKPGFEREVTFINSEEFVNVSVSLTDFSFTDFSNENYNFSHSGVEIRVGTESQRKSFSEVGESLSIESKNFILHIIGAKEGKLNGTLTLEIPKGYVKNTTQTVNFHGRLDSYTTYEPFEGERLGYDINCKVIDSGSEDSSYTLCNFKTPEGSIENPEQMTFPISADSLHEKEMKYQKEINEQKELANAYLTSTAIMITLFVVVMLFLLWKYYIEPKA